MNNTANDDSALAAAAGDNPKVTISTPGQEPIETDMETIKKVGGMGHNVAGDRLKSFIERVERLEEEKATLQEDIKEVYAEAKGVGFDVKTMRKIVKLKKMDTEKRREEAELLDLYADAIGLQGVLL